MKRTFVLLSLAVLCLTVKANATVVRARFTFDDGSPVVGKVVLFRVATPADVPMGTYTLDAQGRISSDIALDPSANYRAQLIAPGGAVLQQVFSLPMPGAAIAAVLQTLPSGEIEIVLAKADASVKSAQFVPSTLAQTKFASCASNPPAKTAPTPDVGGGLFVGWIVTGQELDCQVQVPVAGNHPLSVRVSCGVAFCGTVHFEYPAGTRVGTEVSVPHTGSWDTYQTLPAGGVSLPAGTVSIRLVVDSVHLNLNWFE
jgi:carbohydrate binding protein with CBM6 domain